MSFFPKLEVTIFAVLLCLNTQLVDFEPRTFPCSSLDTKLVLFGEDFFASLLGLELGNTPVEMDTELPVNSTPKTTAKDYTRNEVKNAAKNVAKDFCDYFQLCENLSRQISLSLFPCILDPSECILGVF
eukprot:2992699-Amphidinium_carterae.1